jgi:cell division septation protein DedD
VTTTEINGATIQVGAFRDRANVDRLVERLREVHDQVQVIQLDNELYRVTMGPFLERQTADGIARELDAEMHLSTRVIEAPMVQVRIAAQ